MEDHRQDIIHEAAVLLAASSCPRIVTLHDVYETSVEMVLILELYVSNTFNFNKKFNVSFNRMAGGELQRMVDIQEGLGEAETIRILRQLLLGLSFLHDRNIAHLDIKPQNILLTESDVGSDVKLCDFGISRLIENGVEVREILGTPDYVGEFTQFDFMHFFY